MRRWMVALAGVALVAALSGCTPNQTPEPTESPTQSSQPTINPTLIPTQAPVEVIDVDPIKFDDGYGGYVFKIGDGRVWCSFDGAATYAICEIDEASAQYKPVAVPETCEYSYGYQLRLWDYPPAEGEGTVSEFVCSGGPYADPVNAQTLAANERVTLAPFTCFVTVNTVRCENESKDFIVLGPKAWALSSN